MVATVELPSFHIECKGTVSKSIKLSILKKWYKQLEDDCPKDKLAVLFHFANGSIPFILIPLNSYLILREIYNQFHVHVLKGETFNPTHLLINNGEAAKNLCKILNVNYKRDDGYAFQLIEDKFFITFEATKYLPYMLQFEKSKDTTSRSEHNISLPESL